MEHSTIAEPSPSFCPCGCGCEMSSGASEPEATTKEFCDCGCGCHEGLTLVSATAASTGYECGCGR